MNASAPDMHALLDLEHFLPYRLSVLSNRISQTIPETYAARFGIAIAGAAAKMCSRRCNAARPRCTIDSIQPSAMVGHASRLR